MTQTNTLEMIAFTPIEPAELTAIEGGTTSDATTIWHGPIIAGGKIWHGPIVFHNHGNRPLDSLSLAK